MSQHAAGSIAMTAGIDLVQAVSQHADGVNAIGQRLLVGTDIHTIGQATDDEHLRAQPFHVGHEAADEVLAVGGTLAGSHNIDDAPLVQVG